MKLTITLLPVLTLTASLASAAPYQPGPDERGSFNAFINPRNGHQYQDLRVAKAAGYALSHGGGRTGAGAGAGGRINVLKRDALPAADADADADVDAEPFYPIHPNQAPDAPVASTHEGIFNKVAQGYVYGHGHGHGPPLQNTRARKQVSRREAMAEAFAAPEPEPEPAPVPEPEPAAAPAAFPGFGSLGEQNNNGNRGKKPSANDLCDARHMVCSGLQAKFRALYGVFQNN